MPNGPGPAGPAHAKDRPDTAATASQVSAHVALAPRTAWLASQPSVLQFVGWAGLLLGAVAATWSFTAAIFNAHPPFFYDGPLYVLQSAYPARGLVMYRDFGEVYGPGVAAVFGTLLGLETPASIYLVAWTLTAILHAINMALIWAISDRLRRVFVATCYLLFMSIVVLFWGAWGWEPLITGLMMAMCLVPVVVIRNGPTRLNICCYVLVSTATMVWRWDRILPMTLVLVGAAVIVWASPTLPSLTGARATMKHLSARLGACAAASAAGMVLGAGIIAAFTLHQGTLPAALQWMFGIPLTTLPYRTLPLPPVTSIFTMDAQWITAPFSLAALATAAVLSFRPWRMPGASRLGEMAVVFGMPVAIMPYAFGRADGAHLLSLTFMIGAAGIISLALWSRLATTATAILCGGILLVPLLASADYHARKVGLRPDWQRGDQLARQWTSGCTDLFPPSAKSLFVGHESYDSFGDNAVILYQLRIDLRPATTFISEEPGQQNTCEIGETVARQLESAQKPMVAVLNTTPAPREPNASLTMQSCGMIESALQRLPHRDLGMCSMAKRTFRIRLYE